jgi:tripartite-type tricarboxylate transporter receptor subunit TctC
MFQRRTFLQLSAGALAMPLVSQVGWAQAYPSRPVRLIVGFPAGGVADLYARLIAQSLSERLGQQFIIDNRPGASGNIGAEAVVRAAPDGYTLLQITSGYSWNMALLDKIGFNFIRDIAPVASIYRAPGVLAVHPSFPAKSGLELLSYVRANPGKVNMASGGIGSTPHVYGELFKKMAGVDMLHVPYRGGGPALVDLLAGQMDVMFESLSTCIEHIKAGKLRALGVTSATRAEVLPDIPAVSEFVPGYEGIGWQGIGAPRNTPAEIIDKLNKEISAILTDPKMKARIAELSGEVFTSSASEFSAFIAAYTENWSNLIKAAGIKVE